MIPWKLWLYLTDLLVEHMTKRTYAAQDALVTFQESVNWPWTASREQSEEWSDICARLDMKPTC